MFPARTIIGVRRLLGGAPPAALAIALIVFLAGLLGLGANVDYMARQREETQAENALKGRIQEVAIQVTANTEWDDAVENLTNHFNFNWAKENIGSYYSQPGRFSFAYVIDPNGKNVFGVDAGKIVPPDRFSALAGPERRLVASVRALEIQRGPFERHSRGGRVLSYPIQANEVTRWRGSLFIVSATLIQPEFGSHLPTGPRSTILITGKPIDAPFLKTFGDRLLLREVRLAPAGTRAFAYIDLKDRTGAALARITWMPEHPGLDMISVAFLPILLGVGAPLLLYLDGRRTAMRLALTLSQLGQARDEADAANAQKSMFLANMSHEIRTPLNGVLAMAQVMGQHPLPQEQRERLAVMRHSGEALLTIVNDILDLSKIEAGRLDLDLQPFDLCGLARALDGLYRPVAKDKGLDFVLRVDPAVAGAWMGDANRLRQICANLIANAIKFTETGSITVRFAPGADGGLAIDVADTGVGVAADKLDMIFDSFRQAESSTSRRFGGTGLGLPISRSLAQMMGGALWVESHPGQGSVFHVEIPLPRAAQAPLPMAAQDPVAAEPSQALRILAADDNATNRQVLAAILEPFEVDLVLVEEGDAAVRAWRDGAYDMILMDVQMPGTDGLEATRRIRAEEAAAGRPRTPIIALTANVMTHQVEQYRAAGMDDCVAKPIRLDALYAAMTRAVDHHGAEVHEDKARGPSDLAGDGFHDVSQALGGVRASH
ncbi:MAG: ATP-binding protein [Caulobacteraceae bacterium]|nr:ATP-binding protein [Caulobacteraceae bacterium]